MKIYCTKCREKTDHTLAYKKYDGSINSGEYTATCVCKHFVKFPDVDTADELDAMIAEHEAQNINAAVPLTDKEVAELEAIPDHVKDILDRANG
jgi:hypothetical protein